MREVAIRFITLNALNDHPLIYLGIFLAWLILLIAAAMSLRQQEFGLGAKWSWFAVITLAPILGLGVYAVFCLVRSDWSAIKFVLGPSKSAKSVRG